MKETRRTLSVVVLAIILLMIMTGCKSSARVISKWDAKEISLYSDTHCYVNIVVEITDQGDSYTTAKEVSIQAGKPLKIGIKAFPVTSYFSEKAEFTNVDVGEPYNFTEGETFTIAFLCLVLCMVIFLIIGSRI